MLEDLMGATSRRPANLPCQYKRLGKQKHVDPLPIIHARYFNQVPTILRLPDPTDCAISGFSPNAIANKGVVRKLVIMSLQSINPHTVTHPTPKCTNSYSLPPAPL